MEPSEQAEADWVAGINVAMGGNSEYSASCTPGYYNNEGRPSEGPGWFGGTYSGGAQAFFQLLREWRAAGNLPGLDVTPELGS